MYQRKNFAYGKVATVPSPAASGTTLALETGQGTRFPNTSGGTYVCVVKQTNLPATPDNAEVVLVTSHDPANDNFIITREQEGSDARTIEVGDEFYLSPTDGVWDQIDKLTTKGDLLGFDTAYARIPVGTDDYVLTADSTDDQGVAWKAIGAESKIIGEVPTGTVNGTNGDFELSEEPFSGTLQVYLNGVRQKITDDYTLSGTTITFVTPPLTGSSILCDFNQNVTPAGNADTLDGQHLSGIVPTLKATGAEINIGTEDAKIVTPKAIQDSYLSNGYNSLARQAIINGNFDVWQRGTSFAGAASLTLFGPDRWHIYSANTNTTFSQQTAALNGSRYSLRVQRNNGNTGTNDIYVAQNLESQDSLKLRGKKVTVSFMAKAGANYSPTSGNLICRLYSGTGTDENILNGFTGSAVVGTITQALTTSWVRYSFTTTNVLADTVNQLAVFFSSTPTGTAGAADYYEITQVQLCAGDVALPFMPKSEAQEKIDCQRYGISLDLLGTMFTTNSYSTTSYCVLPVKLPVKMRVAPTLSFINISGSVLRSGGGGSGTGYWVAGNMVDGAVWSVSQANFTINVSGTDFVLLSVILTISSGYNDRNFINVESKSGTPLLFLSSEL